MSRTIRSVSHFYPRPPGGGRHQTDVGGVNITVFLSTPSGWRATASRFVLVVSPRFLSTPSGWRATPPLADDCKRRAFLSTPSGWRATLDKEQYMRQVAISIHALRVEGDRKRQHRPRQRPRFLSTPSGWRATNPRKSRKAAEEFLSTPSGWRATTRPESGVS